MEDPDIISQLFSPWEYELFDQMAAEQLAGVFRALAEPTRLRILSLLASAADGEGKVSDLVPAVGLSQPTVSHHLKVLFDAGMVEREARGMYAFFRPSPSAMERIAGLLIPPRKRASRRRS